MKNIERPVDFVDGLLGILGVETCYAAPSRPTLPVVPDPEVPDPEPDISISVSVKRFAVWSNGSNGINDSGDSPTEFLGDDVGILGH